MTDMLHSLANDLNFLKYESSIEMVKPSYFDFPSDTLYTEVSGFSEFGLDLVKNFLHIGLLNESTAKISFYKNRILLCVWPSFVSPTAYEDRRSYLNGIKKIKTLVFSVPESVFLKYSNINQSHNDMIASAAIVAPFEEWKIQERLVISSFYHLIFDRPNTDSFGEENIWRNSSMDQLDSIWKKLLYICCGPPPIAYVIKRLIKRNWARLARLAVSDEKCIFSESLVVSEGALLSLLIKWSKFSFKNEEFFACLNKVNTTKPIPQPSMIFQMVTIEHIRALSQSMKYKCEHCAYSTNHNSKMTLHARTHTGERPFACNVCGKAFAKKSNLVVHNILHTGLYPYHCQYCAKPFTTNETHLMHLGITHKHDVAYRCYKCKQHFKDEANLQTHMSSHANDPVYQCTVCFKRFDAASKLKEHEQNHSDDKPFKCSKCNKGFLRERLYNDHMNRHQGTALFDCEICGKPFNTNGNRRRHQLLVHPNENTD